MVLDRKGVRMKKANIDLKIHGSKRKLYYICPFLDKITDLLRAENLSPEVRFEIERHCESVRAIARHLRGEDLICGMLHTERIHSPYNFSAVIKTIKNQIKYGSLTEEKLDEIVELYCERKV